MKVKANELRIGNIVDYFSESADHWFNAREVSANDIVCLDLDTADHADAVPLTIAWMIKLGFSKSENNDSFYCIKLSASILSINPDNGVVWIDNPIGEAFNNPALIEYVHQLQNLYFALTGEELKC